ncbi:MAG: crossover junction endodeoxyribonuclease RuvC [Patescibacteria group bacterium]|nr:crossover junction endodeoxyribonuclease RuvC [Patescibacteria group bacterium]
MRVLAFDPGFERLGVAVVEKINGPSTSLRVNKEILVHSECVRTPATAPFSERLALLGKAAEGLIKKYRPDAVSLEDVYFAKNEKTAMKVAEVRGILVFLAASKGIPLYEYTPSEVKVAITGYGKSDKTAVAAMVARLVSLPQKIRLDDEVDAIAVGLTCLACEASAKKVLASVRNLS